MVDLLLFSLQPLQNTHVIALRSFKAIGGSDVQGAVAVGGPCNISSYSFADQLSPPTGSALFIESGMTRTTRNDLVVCGLLTFGSGAVLGGGNGVYTDPLSSVIPSKASVKAPGRFIRRSTCPIDFVDAYIRLKTLSLGLASYVRTGTSVLREAYVTACMHGCVVGREPWSVCGLCFSTISAPLTVPFPLQ